VLLDELLTLVLLLELLVGQQGHSSQ